MKPRKKIAVIGGGVAGITAAYILQKKYSVTLFEQNNHLGGHTNTVIVKDSKKDLPVDTGFIVFNDHTYPLFNKLLDSLDVKSQYSDMSFGFCSKKNNFSYSSDPKGLLGANLNFIKPMIWRIIKNIIRFNTQAVKDLKNNNLKNLTLGQYLSNNKFPNYWQEMYLLPMASAIWSASLNLIKDFPAEAFLHFFENHGLLRLTNRLKWKTIPGGSQTYIEKFKKSFNGMIHTDCPVKKIAREKEKIVLSGDKINDQKFDIIVIAVHADQAYRLLDNLTDDEKRTLGVWKYSKNNIFLHKDKSLMPSNRKTWASWNYLVHKETQLSQPVSVTYYMNRLQKLETETDYFVSLNSPFEPDENSIFYKTEYEHPQYTFSSLNTQKELAKLNGKNNTYFCGSYCGYGFHEDAVRSSVTVAKQLGVDF